MNTQVIFYPEEEREELCEFIEKKFGPDCRFISHELDSEYVHTDVQLLTSENGNREFVTSGMGARPMNSPTDFERTELVMSSSTVPDTTASESYLICNELRNLSKFPFRNDTWFGPGHTINVSEAFEERFGYPYVAFYDSGVYAEMESVGEIGFLRAVPIYEDEYDWIVENDTEVFLHLLHEKLGDAMFCVDCEREHVVPEHALDEDDKFLLNLMRTFHTDWETVQELAAYLEDVSERGEEITRELVEAWLEQRE